MSSAEPKVVLVTGASAGIGKCCAEHLAARGYRVFGTSRRPAAAPAAVGMIAMDVDEVIAVLEKAAADLG